MASPRGFELAVEFGSACANSVARTRRLPARPGPPLPPWVLVLLLDQSAGVGGSHAHVIKSIFGRRGCRAVRFANLKNHLMTVAATTCNFIKIFAGLIFVTAIYMVARSIELLNPFFKRFPSALATLIPHFGVIARRHQRFYLCRRFYLCSRVYRALL
jgi:hypothetical protein